MKHRGPGLILTGKAVTYRVALYARVSTKDKGQDTANQLRDLRHFCKIRRWPIIGEYIDHASASGKVSRVHFGRLMQDAGRRAFDLVLFWSLDRFSREGVLDTLQHLNRLTAAGVEWKSFTEQYLDSAGIFRDVVTSMLATLAKQERLRLSERTRAGMAVARARGAKFGRPKAVFNPSKLRRLRLQGKSVRAIAALLKISTATVSRAIREL